MTTSNSIPNQIETFVNNLFGENFDTVLESAPVKAARKAARANIGLFGFAYDQAKTLPEAVRELPQQVNQYTDTANEQFTAWFNDAVERGTTIETAAFERAEKIREDVNERFEIETRLRSVMGRAETAVEEVVEIAEDTKDAVVEAIAAPFEGYDNLTAKQVIEKITDLTNEQLSLVEAFEKANAQRKTVLRAIERSLAA